MKQCKIVDCQRRHYCRGWCNKHYELWRTTGNPVASKRVVGENRLKHPLYKTYSSMLSRCNLSSAYSFKYYGGRGIKVCDRWSGLTGFNNFVEDMGKKPSPQHSLDRIDNNGDYEPTNCKWSTKSEQLLNRRKYSNNTSGHVGITKRWDGNGWVSTLSRSGRTIYIGSYNKLEVAILKRQQYLQKHLK